MSTQTKSAQKEEATEEVDYSLNDVALRGWVTTIASERELPSGDLVVQFRIAISRPEGGVDTIDLESWSAKTRRTASSLKDGEWVEISGSIRRRFWKSGGALASRWQVVTSEIKRL
jgi:single-strand DNA-binding protein